MASEGPLHGGKVIVPEDEDFGEVRICYKYNGGCPCTNQHCKSKAWPRLSPKLWSFVSQEEVLDKLVNHLTQSPAHLFPDSEVARNEVIDGLNGGVGSIDACEEDWDMRQTHRDWAAKWAKKKVQTSSASASSKRCAKEEVALDAQYLREAATEFQAEWAGSEERKMPTMFAQMMWSIHNPSEYGADADSMAYKIGSIMSLTTGDVFGGDFSIVESTAAKKARVSIAKAAASSGATLPANAFVKIDVDNIKTLAHVMVRTKREVRTVKAQAADMEATARQMQATANGIVEKMGSCETLLEDCQTDLARILAKSFGQS